MKKIILLIIMLSVFCAAQNTEAMKQELNELKNIPSLVLYPFIPTACENGKSIYYPISEWKTKQQKFDDNIIEFIEVLFQKNTTNFIAKKEIKKLKKDISKNTIKSNRYYVFCVNEKEK